MERPLKLHEIKEWSSDRLPFTLLSQAIFRNEAAAICHAGAWVGENDYVQVAICGASIGREGRISATGIPIVEYRVERVNQFRLRSLYISQVMIAQFCERQLRIVCKGVELPDYLTFLIRAREGRYVIVDSDRDSIWVLRGVRASRRWAVGARLFLLCLPEPIFNMVMGVCRRLQGVK